MPALAVTYTVQFDMPAMVDQVCAQTKICDCTVTWSGAGKLREQSGARLTFEGTWKMASGTCHPDLLLWSPADGTAFHTVRLSEDRATVLEWIAHDRLEDSARITTDTKAKGQVWLAELAAPIDPASHVAVHQERDRGMVGPFELVSDHTLTLVLTP